MKNPRTVQNLNMDLSFSKEPWYCDKATWAVIALAGVLGGALIAGYELLFAAVGV